MRRTKNEIDKFRYRLADCFFLGFTAEEAAKRAGCSRQSAQKYYRQLISKSCEALFYTSDYNKKTPIKPDYPLK